jgi:hypothetical protein
MRFLSGKATQRKLVLRNVATYGEVFKVVGVSIVNVRTVVNRLKFPKHGRGVNNEVMLGNSVLARVLGNGGRKIPRKVLSIGGEKSLNQNPLKTIKDIFMSILRGVEGLGNIATLWSKSLVELCIHGKVSTTKTVLGTIIGQRIWSYGR